MSARRAIVLTACVTLSLSAACDSLPGKPQPGDEPIAADRVVDFDVLFAKNCAACHGTNGAGSAARPLNDPTYLAVVDDGVLRDAIARGVPGTPMPPFAVDAGGNLTAEQVNILATEIRRRWGGVLPASTPLLAEASDAGDPRRGGEAFATNCARCHGADGTGGPNAGSVVDRAFLGLASDRGLRITITAGRPDLGMPDWRGYVPGRELTSGEVADIGAWLAAHR
jgi:mono/diheme cytochrome c family protein